ncbi:Histidine phosphatase [Parasponia andersonii]|uniref:Histidine phosphatase n=1 Tax=Parasponia andersonii TaxID=3476 RepID=A0A2P5B5B1_PARAD|nr:Histidine phosphatase [Parasponia andersonii]
MSSSSSTWLPLHWLLLSPSYSSLLQSQSANYSFRFSGAQTHQFLGHSAASPLTFTLTRRSTHSPGKTEFSMAESDSSVGYFEVRWKNLVIKKTGQYELNHLQNPVVLKGHLDVELNDAGRQQAAAVADRLSKETKISVIYTSDLKRALETAEIIAASCGGVEVIRDPDLRERHLGDLQGVVFRDAAKSCPEAYEAFISPKKDQEIPGGGESRDLLFQRCTSSLQKIGRKHKGERVVVVTHGGVIRSLYKRACLNEKSGGKVLNTSVNVFHLSDGDKWTLEVQNDVSHLNPTGYLESGFGGDRTSAFDDLDFWIKGPQRKGHWPTGHQPRSRPGKHAHVS